MNIAEVITQLEADRDRASRLYQEAQENNASQFANAQYWYGYFNATIKAIEKVQDMKMALDQDAKQASYGIERVEVEESLPSATQRYQVLVSHNDSSGGIFDWFEDAAAYAKELAHEPPYVWQRELSEGVWEASWMPVEENTHGVGNLIHVAVVEEEWLLEVTDENGALADSKIFTSLYESARAAFDEAVMDYPDGYKVVMCRHDEDTGQLDPWEVLHDSTREETYANAG